jgi:hypothetical protein
MDVSALTGQQFTPICMILVVIVSFSLQVPFLFDYYMNIFYHLNEMHTFF